MNLIWWLFALFWVMLACVYVPLCFCPVPYEGPYVTQGTAQVGKRAEAKDRERAIQQQKKDLAEHEARIDNLLTNMAASANLPASTTPLAQRKMNGEADYYKKHAEKLLQENDNDFDKALEAWNKPSAEKQVLKQVLEDEAAAKASKDDGLLPLPGSR